ncbi:HD family phosphohydrolase [Amycolatopsis albispora]|uniref:HD family phosphohydrolase n=1 Tax=Amycolatopsis albispora TaxID=1804986 RepID=A0A344L983_9PSEU|nr:HD family phosphohydrolase [Amycolatopsis albispora]AXB44607.1 HD family phosphohydrolase [Amycolatopsis albispora]
MRAHTLVHATFSTVPAAAIDAVEQAVRQLCRRYAERLPFHGWHHVSFVRSKAVGFAERNGADVSIVETAALVHDVNYLVRRNSPAAEGSGLRMRLLADAGVPLRAAERIDAIIDEAEMANRGPDISLEAQALSDADTLFKALPVTPVILAHKYLRENGLSLRELANKIVGEQRDVHDEGYYFYNAEAAAEYSRWALANLELWQCIKEAVDDPAVEELLDAVDAAAS